MQLLRLTRIKYVNETRYKIIFKTFSSENFRKYRLTTTYEQC